MSYVLKELGFEASHIKSIARTKSNICIVEEILATKCPEIKELKLIGFKPENLSCILRGSKQNVAEGIDALLSRKKALEQLIQITGFTLKKISGILRGAGFKADLAIDAFLNRAHDLMEFIGLTGFTTNNISSILYGCGAKAPEGIDALLIRRVFSNIGT